MIPAELFGLWHPPRSYQVLPPWAKVLTSMFLHGGWFHLLGNMLYLWIFGNNVEDVLGRGRYLFFYLSLRHRGRAAQAFANPASHIPMVGASGAIAGFSAPIFCSTRRECALLCLDRDLLSHRQRAGLDDARPVVRDAAGERLERPPPAGRGGVLGACRRLCRPAWFWSIVLRPSGVACCSRRAARPLPPPLRAAFAGRRTSSRGSVPQAGRRFLRHATLGDEVERLGCNSVAIRSSSKGLGHRLSHFLQEGQPLHDAFAVLCEIVLAVARSAVDRNARPIRFEWNELDRDDVRESGKSANVGCRRTAGCRDRPRSSRHVSGRISPLSNSRIIAPTAGEDRAGDRFGRRAIPRRAGEKAGLRQRRAQLGDADRFARSEAIFSVAAHIDRAARARMPPIPAPSRAVPSTIRRATRTFFPRGR